MNINDVQIRTAHNVGIDVEVAGLGDRVLAALVDYLIIGSLFVGLVVVVTFAESLALFIAGYLPLFAYFLLCEVFLDGQSIGKRVRGLRVARLDGTPPTLGTYVLRWLLRIVEIDLAFGTVAFVTILVNGRGQRLGDLAAGTTVVRVKRRLSLEDTVFTPTEEGYVPQFAQVDRLDDEDVATARAVLAALIEEGTSRTAFHMGTRIKAALETKMGVRSDLTPPHFLRTIIRDYNHIHGRGV